MVTLKHIAEKAGVTVSVVSRALNARPDRHARVAPETKARIEDVARQLGFRRNRSAEFLKRGKSPVIQVYLPSNACGLMADLIHGLAESAETEDFPLSFTYGVSEESFSAFLKSSIQNRHCGVVAFHPRVRSGFWDRIQPDAGDLKMVTLNPCPHLPDCYPVLSVGYEEAGDMAASHLLARNCSSLGVVGQCPRRLSGFEKSALKGGVPVQRFAPSDMPSVVDWVRSRKEPAGLFCLTDILALKTIHSLNGAGLRVPEDVLVMGHDNRDFAAHIDPALTTIHHQYREQGREGIRTIIRMMQNEAVSSRVISPVLVARKSA
jgi:LacI family transcriptional regulator